MEEDVMTFKRFRQSEEDIKRFQLQLINLEVAAAWVKFGKNFEWCIEIHELTHAVPQFTPHRLSDSLTQYFRAYVMKNIA